MTDPGQDGVGKPSGVSTLDAEDLEHDDDIEDRLRRADLKARLFGARAAVSIGRYEIRDRIGRGGMGTVYVAHDPELDRLVALKLLRPDRRGGQERMLREARALARLSHPNVVTVHEVGLHDDRVFVAMELIRGRTLREWLETGPPRDEVFAVFGQAARGLRAAHEAGLVHRDFKPDNVLIGDDDRVRVVDFGVVKPADTEERAAGSLRLDAADDDAPELTRTGQLLGTPAYMAAEQFLGETVDARTDVFALCITLYEALEGRRPFSGDDSRSVCHSVLHDHAEPLRASGVPRALTAVIAQGLQRRKEDRPESLDCIIDALDAARGAGRAPRRRLPWAVGMLGAAGLVVGGLRLASRGPEVVAIAQEQPARTDAQDAAFAAIEKADDDQDRRAAAKRFLADHGAQASAGRRAFAHATLGDVLWRASCAEDLLGLCVARDEAAHTTGCRAATRAPLVPVARDSALRSEADHHLRAALDLDDALASDDVDVRRLDELLAGARVQRLDADLEHELARQAADPQLGRDARPESASIIHEHLDQLQARTAPLRAGYAAVDHLAWAPVAYARMGLLHESPYERLGTAALPQAWDETQRSAHCEALAEPMAPLQSDARSAYQQCVQRAEQGAGGDPALAAWCRDRLASIPAPPTAEQLAQRARDEAFTEMISATSDGTRRRLATRFLEQHGEQTTDARRAIAHATLGDVQWRASCPSAVHHGLCVDEQAPPTDRCEEPSLGRFSRVDRKARLAEDARHHLEAAVALAGVQSSADDDEARRFHEAIDRARVQLADAGLEHLLSLKVPDELEFDTAKDPTKDTLSRDAFALYLTTTTERRERLDAAYDKVSDDPWWAALARARKGMTAEYVLASLYDVPIPFPKTDDAAYEWKRDNYCEALDKATSKYRDAAVEGYAACLERARGAAHGDGSIASYCRARRTAIAE